jgi:glucose/arabinose dehydrogenase
VWQPSAPGFACAKGNLYSDGQHCARQGLAGGREAGGSIRSVNAYAASLDYPRWLYTLPNGDILVAETDGPPRPQDSRGFKGWFYRLVQTWAGAEMPSANRITLLRDIAGRGVANARSVFLQGLNSPFGMALIGHDLYVANTDAVMRFSYIEGDTDIHAPGVKLCDLPGGPLNHHWTKSLIASRDFRTSQITS